MSDGLFEFVRVTLSNDLLGGGSVAALEEGEDVALVFPNGGVIGLVQLIALEEPAFHSIDRNKISDRHERQRAHEGGGQRNEAEPGRQRRIGKRYSQGEGEERRCHKRRMRRIAQGISCADDEDHQGLRREQLDEPASMKQLLVRMEDLEQQAESDEVEDRAQRPEHEHELADHV